MNIALIWDYVWRNALMQLRHRHAGSLFGPLWLLLSPLAQITIYSLVFTRIMETRIKAPGGLSLSFTLYLCAGLMPWVAFSEHIGRAQTVLIQNASYILNTALPEQVLVLRDALETYLLALLSIILVLGFSLLLGNAFSFSWLVLPVVILLLSTLALGIGTFVAVLSVFLRDLGPILSLILRLWFWITPIVYVPSVLPESLQRIVHWNPVFPYIHVTQRVVLYGEYPNGAEWLAMAGIAAVALSIGFGALRYLRNDLRDVL